MYITNKFGQDLLAGLKLIETIHGGQCEVEIGYVPNSFENGTPANPNMCYVCVTSDDIGEYMEDELAKLGWTIDYPNYSIYG